MTLFIDKDRINNIFFFNPTIIKENSFKRNKYMELINDPDNLIIYPPEEDGEKKKMSLFKKFREDLYKGIRSSGKFCDGLQALYVKDSIKDCDAVLRVESSRTRSKKINGFATLKFMRNSKTLYIDVICTNSDVKGTGSYIIKLLSDICNKLSLEHIKLSSATQALPFYLKTDFECDPLCKMVKDITGGEKSSNMTRKRISRSSNKHSKTCRHY
jgi:hypothetical protein